MWCERPLCIWARLPTSSEKRKTFVQFAYLKIVLKHSASLAQQWILCSEWVPSEWVQTADKNITLIHTTPVHQLTSCKANSSVFVRQYFFSFKMLLPVWNTSPLWIHNIDSLVKKVVFFYQQRNMHRSNTVYKQKQWILMWEYNRVCPFSLEKAL